MTVGAIFATTYRREAARQGRFLFHRRAAAAPKPGANKEPTTRTASTEATPPKPTTKETSFTKEYGCENISDLAWMLVP